MLNDEIVSRLSILSFVGSAASGLKVLSEGYAYPILSILNLLSLPIDFETATKLAFTPFSEETSINSGSIL